MTQYEILKFASIGISTCIERENQINQFTILKSGHEDSISILHLEKLSKQFAEVLNLMGDIERNSKNA